MSDLISGILEMKSEIARLRAENADLRSGEYLARVVEERDRMREALETIYLSFHGSNPSDAMADMSREDYLAYTLREARLYAKAAITQGGGNGANS